MSSLARVSLAAVLASAAACAGAASTSGGNTGPVPVNMPAPGAPNPDPRVGLKAGMWDAGTAQWNMRLVSATRPSERFINGINSDLAFTGNYAIQGSFNGYQVWDISNPAQVTLKTAFYCPASQSDVSVYKNLLFVSAEAPSARLDCGATGVKDPVSKDRLRGIRIFDITDISNPKYITNVQTCRGSHTHTVLADPRDPANVYVYISGSSAVRPDAELGGCADLSHATNSGLFRIEVIKVPVAHPEQAALVSTPRIFQDLAAPPSHGNAPEDVKEINAAKAKGMYVVNVYNMDIVLPPQFTKPLVDSVAKANGHATATTADSAALRASIRNIVGKMWDIEGGETGPTQCHDITVYPAIGLAGGACEGYGLLLDIRDPANPKRIAAAADSNFSYWHSATFNNDGTKVLFSDEWGGGGQPKCRASDPKQWGADALFTIDASRKMQFQSYYKMPAVQTSLENCVAHNGSLIPIPGRDVMVQAWYQGGVSVFDWTDVRHPMEIAFFDRGPIDSTHFSMGGSWSVYWYNGVLVSSEIARGLDVFELTPNALLTQNEIDAAKTVHLDFLNTQGQPKFTWPASFALARAYVDQLERSHGLGNDRIAAVRQALSSAESGSGTARQSALTQLASQLDADARASADAIKARLLASAVRDLAVR
jgi:hypothetical protein